VPKLVNSIHSIADSVFSFFSGYTAQILHAAFDIEQLESVFVFRMGANLQIVQHLVL